MFRFHCLVHTKVSVQAPGTCMRFVTRPALNGEELLAPRPTLKLEDRPLSAVRDCLFNIFAATPHTGGRSSNCKLRRCHALGIGTHLYIYRYITFTYTGCPRRNGQNFGRVFLMLNYTDITQNTYIQS